MARFEDKYMGVLYSVESMIVHIYEEHPDLRDYQVEQALTALLSFYRRPEKGIPRLKGLSRTLFDEVRIICDIYLGHETLQHEAEDGTIEELSFPPLSVEELLAVLRRIRKSVRMWNKVGGPQGYLHYIQQFIT